MPISEYIEEFAGKHVLDWDGETGFADPENTLPRISLSYDEHERKITWLDKFAHFIDHPDAAQVPGIVIGAWDMESGVGSSLEIVQAVVAACDRLPKVESIFFGDITYEECEISWIQQSDITQIFVAFPQLKHLVVRGGNDLKIGSVEHENLQMLGIQTGGLDSQVVQAVLSAKLPALEHLELWLGEENYGASVRVEHLQPLFAGDLFPKLQTLGLRNSEIADDIAKAIVSTPLLERLKILDLSLGTLGDEGAAALLEAPGVQKLQKLDLHHHFCSEATVEKLQQLPIEVDVSDTQSADEYDGEEYRYVSVGE